MKFKKIVILSIVVLIGLSGILYLNFNENANADTEKNRSEMRSNAEKDTYRGARKPKQDFNYGQVVKEIKAEPEIKKLDKGIFKYVVISVLTYHKLYGEETTPSQAIQEAKKTLETNNAFVELAEKEYGITMTDEEVHAYIDKHAPTDLEDQVAFAEALGITVHKLNHEVDFHSNRRGALFNGAGLKEKVMEKYNISKDDENTDGKAWQAYEKELQDYMNK